MRSHSHSHRGRRGWSLTLGDNASSTGHGKRNEDANGGKETGERLDDFELYKQAMAMLMLQKMYKPEILVSSQWLLVVT